MKKALICPNEPVSHGYRVAQVEPAENIFPVAEPTYWLDCSDDAVADKWYYDTIDNIVKEVPKPIQPTTTGSQTL
jgi:hypothetical protein